MTSQDIRVLPTDRSAEETRNLVANAMRAMGWTISTTTLTQVVAEQLSNVVFWEVELSGDFFLHHTVFEGTAFDHQHDLFMAS